MGRVKDGYEELVKWAKGVADAKGFMAGWDKVVQFSVQGEGDFHLKFDDGLATFHEGKNDKSDVTLKGSGDVFYKMLTRELQLTRVYFAKQCTAEGSMSDAIKFGRTETAVSKVT